jgi:hypothetical protein
MTATDKKMIALAKKIERVVPYVLATLSDGSVVETTRHRSGELWAAIHDGRRRSSLAQLEQLLMTARELMKADGDRHAAE